MKEISIIIPAFNEEKNISVICEKIQKVVEILKEKYVLRIVFVNDGSTDNTIGEIEKISNINSNYFFIDFSRNFGKEIATTAGLNNCENSDACIIIDADLQHPVELIPDFIKKWEMGNEIVIGIRNKSKSDSLFKKIGSIFFYKLLNSITEMEIVAGSTDYRLIDKVVVLEFNKLTETRRMTRALIDWLGFKREYIYFDANKRLYGNASYSTWKLIGLAMNSFVSLSLLPLKFAGYLGFLIVLVSGIFGSYILLGKYFLRWDFPSTFSDSENLAILIVFLVGIILSSVGLLALYVANIHEEVLKRPMYIIRKKKIV